MKIRGARRKIAGGLLPAAGAAALAAAVASPACYRATQLEISISTDLPCNGALRTAIYKGLPFGADPAAHTDVCTPLDGVAGGNIGSIVFVPSEDRNGRSAVKVVLAADGDVARCATDPKACIVATRSFSFVEHHSQRLPIRMLSACLGKACGPGLTCNPLGNCVPDAIECTGADCRSPADVIDAPAPPPVEPVDAGQDAGADVDAGPMLSPCGGSVDGVLATISGGMPSFAAAEDGVFYFLNPFSKAGLNTTLFRVDAAGSSGPAVVTSVSTDGAILGLVSAGTKWVVAYDKPVGPTTAEHLTTADGNFGLGIANADGLRAIAAEIDANANLLVYVVRPTRVDRVNVVTQGIEQLFPFGGDRIAFDSAATYVDVVGTKSELVVIGTQDKSERRLPLSTTEPVLFAKHLDAVFIGVNGATDSSVGALASSSSVTTLTPLTIFPARLVSLAADATNVYFATSTEVQRIPRAGIIGGTTPVYTAPKGTRLGHLAVTASCVYFWEEVTNIDPAPARLRGIPKPP